MNAIREFLNRNPWLGWVLAGIMVVVAVVMYYRLSGGSDPNSVERLSQTVTIRSAETGEEWTMNRGMMEQALMSRPGLLDHSVGLPDPKTGKPTGFPVDRDWNATIERLNRERQALIDRRKAATPPAKTNPNNSR